MSQIPSISRVSATIIFAVLPCRNVRKKVGVIITININNMKRILLVLSALLLGTSVVSAQDLITKKNGEDIKAKVIEIDNSNVKYRLYDEPEGPLYIIPKSQVLLIRHESGRNEVFSSASHAGNVYGNGREPVEGICPGMKYKQLKTMYNYSDWYSGMPERYNPALMGVSSWFIPGLGQMISGEVGRGLAWLGGTAGCYALLSIGVAVNAGAYSMYDGGYDEDMATIGALIIAASYLGLLTVDICAIVDACRVAKVKNMYEHDLRRVNYSLNLYPSVDYVKMANGVQPTAGLTLAMRF